MTDPLREAMDAVGGGDSIPDDDPELYGDLAPVFDFVSGRRYDYSALDRFVATHVDSAAERIGVGACGGGRLLRRLGDRYPEAVGIDRSRRMLELARSRTDAPLLRADLQTQVTRELDAFTLLGGTVCQLMAGDDPADDPVVATFEAAYDCLSPGGLFLCDFMPSGTLRSGEQIRDSYESGRFQVDRTVLTAPAAPSPTLGTVAQFAIGYEVTDQQQGDTVQTATVDPICEFETGALLGTALAAGFENVQLVTPPTLDAALLARRR